ncbi:MAG TPA: type II secretion system protein GspM [Alicycliphilus sp.]|nr:type II secretion system protein GspM [Alicycliphilus sp.]
MNLQIAKDKWILAATVLVLLSPIIAGGVYVYQKHQWAAARLAELEPRYARMEGILAAQPELEQANQQADAMLGVYLYPADKVLNQAGNEMQQQVRDMLSAGGLRVGSSQVLPPKADNTSLDRIQLTIKAEGELLALQTAMIGLKSIKPAVFVDSLSVSVMGAPRAEVPQNLSIQLELSAWRVHP